METEGDATDVRRNWLAGAYANLTLEVDPDYTADTSDKADGAAEAEHGSSGSDNVTESGLDSRYENGRRYHSSEAVYHVPNDNPEQERLNLQNRVFTTELDGNNFIAPLPKDQIRKVLDIGCGTGYWCIETANELPHADVHGVDISLYHPTSVPPNCTFDILDVNSDWKFEREFDLIHMRAMVLPITNWPKVLKQAYDALAPGGYLELHECNPVWYCMNPSPSQPSYIARFGQGMEEACEKVGRNVHIIETLGTLMKDAGFTDVSYVPREWPVGDWAKGEKNKVIGRLMTKNLTEATKSAMGYFVSVLGWTKEDYEPFAVKVLEEMNSGKMQSQLYIYIGVGRKPLTEQP